MVEGSGLRVEGLGCGLGLLGWTGSRAHSSGCRGIRIRGSRVFGPGFRAQISGCRVQDKGQGFRGSGVQGFRGSRVQGFRGSGVQGFRVQGAGCIGSRALATVIVFVVVRLARANPARLVRGAGVVRVAQWVTLSQSVVAVAVATCIIPGQVLCGAGGVVAWWEEHS